MYSFSTISINITMVSIVAQTTPSAGMPSLKDDATRLDMFGGMRLNLGGILATGAYADFEIRCGKHTFKVHKAILRTASPFFKAAIEGNTKVSAPDISQNVVDIISSKRWIYKY